MKTILVAGGAGFIGSNLCKFLLNKGNKVICLDNFYTGNYKNIKDLTYNKNFKLINHDIINKFNYKEKIDEIYNLACPASPVHYQKDPIYTAKTSFLGALNLLYLAKEKKAKIFQASTSEIYGNPLIHPQIESYKGNVNPIGIRACYDEGKRIAETLFFDFYRKYNIKIKVVRIFNTYGPNMGINDGRVVNNFIIQALLNKDITVYGDGSQSRSFCFIDDLIEGFYKMMNSPDEIIGPINLGNPEEYTIIEVANKIIKLTKTNSKIVFKPLPPDDPIKRKPDISLAKSYLNWTPETTFENGLIKTIKYFKNILDK